MEKQKYYITTAIAYTLSVSYTHLIEKTIENRHLEDQILEVRVPLEEVSELKNGVMKQVQTMCIRDRNLQ